jgi:viroplasmin and RNaseH domain-containing protein
VFATWEECEQQVTGYANAEFKRFDTMEVARQYLLERRLNFMAFRRPTKPDSSFVGGKTLRV